MSATYTFVFIPGAWHQPTCYSRIITLLEDEHNIKCISITLPSTGDNPEATYKDDIDTARAAITSETTQGRNVVVIAHSYGGMVGNSAIKGLTRRDHGSSAAKISDSTTPPVLDVGTASTLSQGHVKALILVASGFTLSGLSFMDPLFGHPPPAWRIDKPSGYAVIVMSPRKMFYHDLTDEDAEYWVSQLTTQSLKALFGEGRYSYAGWRDVPTLYVGTIEDRGLPVAVQRVQVGMARAMGGDVRHVEMRTSHSPFLSRPREVVQVMMEFVRDVGMNESLDGGNDRQRVAIDTVKKSKDGEYEVPSFRLDSPRTWITYGLVTLLGRAIGRCYLGYLWLKQTWGRKQHAQ